MLALALLDVDLDLHLVDRNVALDHVDDLALHLLQFFRREVAAIRHQHELEPLLGDLSARRFFTSSKTVE